MALKINMEPTKLIEKRSGRGAPASKIVGVFESFIYCRTPVWLKTFSSVLVQEGGGGRCTAGVRKGKIGARVGLGRGK